MLLKFPLHNGIIICQEGPQFRKCYQGTASPFGDVRSASGRIFRCFSNCGVLSGPQALPLGRTRGRAGSSRISARLKNALQPTNSGVLLGPGPADRQGWGPGRLIPNLCAFRKRTIATEDNLLVKRSSGRAAHRTHP